MGFRRIKDGRSRQSHWINRLDGDLWVFWERVITARGANTIRVKWIPGHQTQQDEDNGRISRHDRRGNDLADELARAGDGQEERRVSKAGTRDTQKGLRMLARTEQRIASTASTRRKPNIATFTFHKQQDRTTRTIRFCTTSHRRGTTSTRTFAKH